MKTSKIGFNLLLLVAFAFVIQLRVGYTAPVPTVLNQARTPFVGYYPSWLNLPDKRLDQVSRTFSHVFLAFALPDIGPFSPKSTGFAKTGLDFEDSIADIRAQIEALQRDGVQVILSVGGSQAALIAKKHGRAWKNLITQKKYRDRLLALANRLGVDGIDMDYEAAIRNNNATVTEYAKVMTILHNLAKSLNTVNAAGNPNSRLFVLTTSPIGADCAPETKSDDACQSIQLNSAWSGAGIERRILKERGMAKHVDMLNIMTYDLGYQAYDPQLAYEQYRSLVPAGVPVNVGLEVLDSAIIGGPLGPEKSILMLNDNEVDADVCPGTVMLNDQYSAIWDNPPVLRVINRPYSVETLAGLVNSVNQEEGRGDGLMLWSLYRIESENLDPGQVSCKGVTAATPETTRLRAAEIMGWPVDELNID